MGSEKVPVGLRIRGFLQLLKLGMLMTAFGNKTVRDFLWKKNLQLTIVILGLFIGESFPDLDQQTDLLLHRSIITHGIFIPIAVFWIGYTNKSLYFRRLALGIMIGLVVHFSFDLFPRGWSGYALISLPIIGWTDPWFSWFWIAISAVTCSYMGSRIVQGRTEAIMFVLCPVPWFLFVSLDEHSFWLPFLTLLVSITVPALLAVRTFLYDQLNEIDGYEEKVNDPS